MFVLIVDTDKSEFIDVNDIEIYLLINIDKIAITRYD